MFTRWRGNKNKLGKGGWYGRPILSLNYISFFPLVSYRICRNTQMRKKKVGESHSIKLRQKTLLQSLLLVSFWPIFTIKIWPVVKAFRKIFVFLDFLRPFFVVFLEFMVLNENNWKLIKFLLFHISQVSSLNNFHSHKLFHISLNLVLL